MEKEITILSANTIDSWGKSAHRNDLLAFTEHVNPDVAFFSEAYAEKDISRIDPAIVGLRSLGYRVSYSFYHDNDARKDRHGLIGIVRGGTGAIESRAGMRSYYSAVLDAGVDFYGLHGDDRSEASRLAQADVLQPASGFFERPTIVAGDLNNLHRHSTVARRLCAIEPLIRILPSVDPTSAKSVLLKPGRIGSLAKRLVSMAEGTMLQRFEEYGLQDADPTMQPTKGFAQLDHILFSGLALKSFTLHDKLEELDHRPISAVFSSPK